MLLTSWLRHVPDRLLPALLPRHRTTPSLGLRAWKRLGRTQHVEHLEPRLVLTVVPSLPEPWVITAGSFANDGQADVFAVQSAGDEITVTVNDVEVYRGRPADLVLEGSQDAETVTIDLTAGSTEPSLNSLTLHFQDDSADSISVQSLALSSGRFLVRGDSSDSLTITGMVTAEAGITAESGSIFIDAAATLTSAGGTIHLDAGAGSLELHGQIDASGDAGGTVRLLGGSIGLREEARVDASGDSGGGSVLIGGGYQGADPALHNAQRVAIDSEVQITADARTDGRGGTVIVWSDETTRFAGHISARGITGGGFVETSGKLILQATGTVDASSLTGPAGEWLLDPNNITIQAAGSDTNVTPGPNFLTVNDNAIVTVASILASLNLGTSVTVTTGTGGANSQSGDILVASSIIKTAGGAASLTLSAHNGIALDPGVSIASLGNNLNVSLIADSDSSGAGSITLSGGSSINGNGGTISLSGQSLVSQGTIASAGDILISVVGQAFFAEDVTALGSASLTVTGNASAGAQNIVVQGGAVLSVVDGDMLLDADQGSFLSGSFQGIQIDGSTLTASGTGSITIEGRAGTGAGSNRGVVLSGTGTQITTASGNISILGTGGTGAGPGNSGVVATTGTVIEAGLSGDVTLQGVAGNGTNLQGIDLTGTEVRVAEGALQLLGTGSASSTGSTNRGIVAASSQIVATGLGTIEIDGLGGTGTLGNRGVILDSSQVSAVDGQITVTGTARSSTTGDNNAGLFVLDSSITASGLGAITLEGTGGGGTGDNTGVSLRTSSDVSSGGLLEIVGTAGTGDPASVSAIDILGGSTVTSTSDSVVLRGDSFDVDGLSSVSASNGVTIETLTAGQAINLGADDTATTLGLTTTEIDRISAQSLTIGSSSSGRIDISAAIAPAGVAELILRGGGDVFQAVGASITETGDILISADGDVTLNDDVRTSGSGSLTVTGNSGAGAARIAVQFGAVLSVEDGNLHLDADQGVETTGFNPGVVINNATIETTGAGEVLIEGRAQTSGGDGITVSNNAILRSTASGLLGTEGRIQLIGHGSANATAGDGVDVSGSTIVSQDGEIRIEGTGASGADNTYRGVVIANSNITTAGAKRIDIDGAGGNGTHSNFGVHVSTTTTHEIRSAGGDVAITGTAGNGTNLLTGIHLENTFNLGVLTVATTGTGQVTLNGAAGQGTGNSAGVRLNNKVTVQVADGGIDIHGVAQVASTGPTNMGVNVLNGAILEATGAGSIDVFGQAGGSNNFSPGVLLQNPAGRMTSGSGDITVTGFGGNGTGSLNAGVMVDAGFLVQTGGSGVITLSGTGGTGSSENVGVHITTTVLVEAENGAIVIDGTASASGTGTGNSGFRIDNLSTLRSTGTATIDVQGTGGGGTDENRGIHIDSGALIESFDGNVFLDGVGGAATGAANAGYLQAGVVRAGGSGSITVTAIGGAGTTDQRGVDVTGASAEITSSSGNILIQGTGGGGSTGSVGVFVSTTGTVQIHSDSGDISLTGQGGSGTFNLHGITLDASAGTAIDIATAGSGDITLAGITGDGTSTSSGIFLNQRIALSVEDGDLLLDGTATALNAGSNNRGVRMETSITLEAIGAGSISIVGQGGGGTNNAVGVSFGGTGNTVDTAGGNVTITGTAGAGTLVGNVGVVLNGVVIQAVQSGDVTVTGTGGTGTQTTAGISLAGEIHVVDGSIHLTGTGTSASTSGSTGVIVNGGSQLVATGTGSITLEGHGGTGVSTNRGVHVDRSLITTGDGHIAVVGAADATTTGVGNRGVDLIDTSVVTTGLGTITIEGTAGGGTQNNQGVLLQFTAGFPETLLIESSQGDISITGQGGGGTTQDAQGIWMRRGTIRSTGAAEITLQGTGGTGATGLHGIHIEADSLIESVDGDVSLFGQSGSASSGILNFGSITSTGLADIGLTVNGTDGLLQLQSTSAIDAGTSDVALTADRMQIVSGSTTAGDVIALRNASAGREINLGSTTDNGVNLLELSPQELATLTGNVLQIGSATAGQISIADGFSLLPFTQLDLFTGSGVAQVGTGRVTVHAVNISAQGDVDMHANPNTIQVLNVETLGSVQFRESNELFVMGFAGIDGISAGGDILLTLDAGDLNLLSRVTTPGNITLTTPGNVSSSGAIGGAATTGNILISADGAATFTNQDVITTAGGTLTVTGNAGAGASRIEVHGTATLSVEHGNLHLDADRGVAAAGINAGIFIHNATIETTGTGEILLEGRGQASGGDGITVSNAFGPTLIRSTAAGLSGTQGRIRLMGRSSAIADGVDISEATVVSESGEILLQGFGGSGGGPNHRGVVVSNASITTAGAASIDIFGTGGLGSDNQRGVEIAGNSTELTTEAGNISITGVGGGGSLDNVGLFVSTTGTIQIGSESGDVSLTGTGGSGLFNLTGIVLDATAGVAVEIATRQSGTVVIAGTAGVASGSSSGLVLTQRVNISVEDGDILLSGTASASGSGSNNLGVGGTSNNTISAFGIGSITIEGQGGAGVSSNRGVSIIGSGNEITTASGDITITGTGGAGTTVANSGIALTGVDIEAGFSGDVTITGTGGTGTGNVTGLNLSAAVVRVTDGTAHLVGTGSNASTDSSNTGLNVGSSQILATGAGLIQLEGVGGTGTQANRGAVIGSSQVIAVNGQISIIGTASASATTENNIGVQLTDATITTTGSAGITIDGIGGGGIQSNHGVLINFSSTLIESVQGAVSITGQAGGSTIGSSAGIAHVEGTIRSTGSAQITLDGRGALGLHGIQTASQALIESVDGDISLTGQSGTGAGDTARGILHNGDIVSTGLADVFVTVGADELLELQSTASIDAGSSNVRLTADRLKLDTGATVAGNVIVVQSATAGREFDLGSATDTAPDTVEISVSEASAFTATVLQIGDATAGQILFTGGVIFAGVTRLDLVTGSGVAQTGGDVTVNALDVVAVGDVDFDESDNQIQILNVSTQGSVAFENSGALSIQSAGGISGISAGGNVLLQSNGGDLNVQAAVTAPGDIDLIANFASITTSASIGGLSTTGNITFDADNTVTINNEEVVTRGAGEIRITGNGGAGALRIVIQGGALLSVEDGEMTLDAEGVGSFTGVVINNSILETIGRGSIFVEAKNTSGDGISVSNNSVLRSTASGLSSARGRIHLFGVSTINGSGDGIDIRDSTIVSTSGAITLQGFAAGGASITHRGVIVANTNITTAGAKSIDIQGIGGGGGANNIGVTIRTSATHVVQSAGGDINISGDAGNGTTDLMGVLIQSTGSGRMTVATTGTGDVSITGTGGVGTGTGRGILLLDASVLVENGEIRLDGEARLGSTGDNNIGVHLNNDSRLQATGTGSISVTGDGGTGGQLNSGVLIQSAVSEGGIVTASGDITVTGRARGGTTIDNSGIQASLFFIVAGGSGKITLTGTGGTGTGFNNGVTVNGFSFVQAADGAIEITGTASTATTTTDNHGVLIDSSTTVRSTGTGTIDIQGTGGRGTSGNNGIRTNGGSLIESTLGDITLSGQGGTGTSGGHTGLFISGSTVRSLGAAAVSLSGTGGTGTGGAGTGNIIGIFISSTAVVSSVGGDISLTGLGGSGSDIRNIGINIIDTAAVTAANSAAITIHGTGGQGTGLGHGVSFQGSARVQAENGAIHIEGRRAATGTGGSSGFLMIETSRVISTGSATIDILGTGSGATDGNGITTESGTFIQTVAGDVTLVGQGGAGTAAFNVGISQLGRITATGGADITLTGTGGTGAGAHGGITLSGVNGVIQTAGGDISLTGTGGSGASGNFSNGVFFENGGSLLASGLGDVTVTGVSGAAVGESEGIRFSGRSRIVTADGDITLHGTSIATAGNDHGILMAATAVVASTGTGNVHLTGFAGGTSGFNTGVNMAGPSGTSTFVGGLDGTSLSSTFETGIASQNLPLLGWTNVSGAARVVDSGTGALIGTTPYDNYEVQFDTGVAIQANTTYTLQLTIGYLTALTGGQSSFRYQLGTISGGVFTPLKTRTGTVTVAAVAEELEFTSGTLVSGQNLAVRFAQTSSLGAPFSDNFGFDTVRLTARQATQIEANGGEIRIEGTGSLNNSSIGVVIGGSVTNTGAGDIFVTGQGGVGTTGSEFGISASGFASFTAVDGNIALHGTGGGTAGVSNLARGTGLGSAEVVTTGNGNITIFGQGGVGGNNLQGVVIESASMIQAAGLGVITIEGHGGRGTASNSGITLVSSQVLAQNGGIELVGQGHAGSTANDNNGVRLDGTTIVRSTGTAEILIEGTAGGGTNNNDGVRVNNAAARVESTFGDITIVGQGGPATGSNSNGVRVTSGTIRSLGSAKVSITGTGGTGTTSARGVFLTGASSAVTSLGGDITIEGTGGTGTGNVNQGIAIANALVQSTGAGSVRLTGTGGSGTDNQHGVSVSGTSTVSAAQGEVRITGVGGTGTAVRNTGVQVGNTALINAANSASIIIQGTGGLGVGLNSGVLLEESARVQAANGSIEIEGQGHVAALGDENTGIRIDNTASVRSIGTGTIHLEGTGGGGHAGILGFRSFQGTLIETQVGDITIIGQGGAGTGDFNIGIQVLGGQVRSLGAGDIELIGTGGTGVFGLVGIDVQGSTALVQSGGGDISMTGAGGEGTSNFSSGVLIEAGASVATVADGSITLTGTAGSTVVGGSVGVWLLAGGLVSTVDGDVTIDGSTLPTTNGSGNAGVQIDGGFIVTSTGTGNIELTGIGGGSGSFNVGVAIHTPETRVEATGGQLTITGTSETATADGIGVFIAGAVRNTADGDITITGVGGDGSTGNNGVQIGGPVTTVDGDIVVQGTGGGLGNESHGILVHVLGIVRSTGTGAIYLEGTGAAGVTANMGFRTFQGSLIETQIGDITIVGQAGAGTGDFNIGIQLLGGRVRSLGAADIELIGVAGTGVFGHTGIDVQGATASIESAGGNISLTGTGGSGTSGFMNGITVGGGAVVTTTGTGTVTMTGTAGTGLTGASVGVWLIAGGRVSTVDGDLVLDGSTLPTTDGPFNAGVQIDGGFIVTSTGIGNIEITGTGGGSGSFNTGVAIHSSSASAFVGGLDGTSTSSTFETGAGTQALPRLGWTNVSGAPGQIFDFGNGALVSTTPYDNYEVQFDTGVPIQANTTYTLHFDMGYIADFVGGRNDYRFQLGTLNGGVFTPLATATGTVNYAGNLNLNVISGSDELVFATGDVVSGNSLAIRWAQTSSLGSPPFSDFFGIDNVTLRAQSQTRVEASGGQLQITGTSTGGSDGSTGVFITGIVRNSAAGDITITGTGGEGSSGNNGVLLDGPVTTVDGDIVVQGTGGGLGNESHGIVVGDGIVRSSGTGAIFLEGTGGAGVTANLGFRAFQTALIETQVGDITILGQGGAGTGNFNIGIQLLGGRVRSLGSADIELIGIGGTGVFGHQGIAVQGATASIESAGGNISLTGIAGSGTSGFMNGLTVGEGCLVTTIGVGSVTLTGTAGATPTGGSVGAWLIGGGRVSTVNGDIVMDGSTLPTTDGSGNAGVQIDGGFIVTSTGSGNVEITGTGTGGAALNDNDGIRLNDALVRTLGTGNIELDGEAGSGNDSEAIEILNGSQIEAAGTGEVRVAMEIDGAASSLRDEIAVDDLDLSGFVLDLSLGTTFTPAVGSTFRLITASSSTTGEFEGLPQDHEFTLNGIGFRITYEGGDGNDIEIIVVDRSLLDDGNVFDEASELAVPNEFFDAAVPGVPQTIVIESVIEPAAVADTDFFLFTAERSGVIEVRQISSEVDSFLAVYNQDEILLAYNDDTDGANSLVRFVAVEGEEYFIRANVVGAESGSYNLEFTFLVDELGNTAIDRPLDVTEPLARGAGSALVFNDAESKQSTTIDFANDIDFVTFVAPVTGRMTITETLAAAGGLDSELAAFRDAGGAAEPVFLDSNDDFDATLRSRVTFNVIAGQRYFVRVSGFGETSGDWALEIATDTAPADADGDILADATPVALAPNDGGGESVTLPPGTVDATGDVDVVSFVASITGQATVVVSTELAPLIVDVIGENVRIANDRDGSDGLSVTFDVIAGERYFVRIATAVPGSVPPEDLTGSYAIAIATSPGAPTDQPGIAPTAEEARELYAILVEAFIDESTQGNTTPEQVAEAVNEIIVQAFIAQAGGLSQFVVPSLLIWFDPLDFIQTDALGRQAGFTKAEKTVNEFGPRAAYTGDGAAELLIIPNFTATVARLDLFGVGGAPSLGGVNLITTSQVRSVLISSTLFRGTTTLFLDFSDPSSSGPTSTLPYDAGSIAANRGDVSAATLSLTSAAMTALSLTALNGLARGGFQQLTNEFTRSDPDKPPIRGPVEGPWDPVPPPAFNLQDFVKIVSQLVDKNGELKSVGRVLGLPTLPVRELENLIDDLFLVPNKPNENHPADPPPADPPVNEAPMAQDAPEVPPPTTEAAPTAEADSAATREGPPVTETATAAEPAGME